MVVSFYNNWHSLSRTLESLACQSQRDFEVIIADDGSNSENVDPLLRYAATSPLRIRHVWHEDLGFRKTKILNAAAFSAQSDYLLFTDGDMVLRRDWVESHLCCARRGQFLTGGSHVNIPAELHALINAENVTQQLVFQTAWLRRQGWFSAYKWHLRLSMSGKAALLFDLLTPRKNAFVGCNSSCWKTDFARVAGFDENLGYGGEDLDLGVRLANSGIKGVRRKYSLVCLHMDHTRAYVNSAEVKRIKKLIRQRKQMKIVDWRLPNQ